MVLLGNATHLQQITSQVEVLQTHHFLFGWLLGFCKLIVCILVKHILVAFIKKLGVFVKDAL